MPDENAFEPLLGRLHAPRGKLHHAYLGQVLAAANFAWAQRIVSVRDGRSICRGGVARGAGVGRLLARHSQSGGSRSRRVVVKASIVRLGGKGAARATAHLRYLQRDGVTRSGDPGRLYGAETDVVDGIAFRERAAGDRHQFRFIVSAEDGVEYEDLRPLTRRLMTQVSNDLGTTLDWVAVDHFNTGHPHTHIVLRGRDDQGADLVIARDYLAAGLRERASDLVDLDLGPRSLADIAATLRAEVQQERMTSLDRALLRDQDHARIVGGGESSTSDRTLRIARLAKLQKLGLARLLGGGRWQLAEDLEGTLQRMGQRGDIHRLMQRELAARGIERASVDQAIYDPAEVRATRLIGRIIGHGLADEHLDRRYLLVDGLDGRTHFVDVGRAADSEAFPRGMIVEIIPLRASVRDIDRTIARVAAAHGERYDIETHLRHDRSVTDAFVQAHDRRLERMRAHGGIVDRDQSGRWIIADDHLERVAAYEARRVRDRPVALQTLSSRPLSSLIEIDAPTWLDRRLMDPDAMPARDAGFGAEVRAAEESRRRWLVARDLAVEEGEGTRFHPGLLAALARRELSGVAAMLSLETGMTFVEAAPHEHFEGVLRKRVDTPSGRFALIENTREFALVPWRPELEHRIGKPVAGIMREDGVSWSFGRGRDGPNVT